MTPWIDREIRTADGLRLHVAEYPALGAERGPPILCLHGLTRNSKDFGPVAEAIAGSGFRTLAMDVRGRGRSERAKDPQSYQPAVYAGDVVTALDQLGIAKVAILGTSMGGLIAMALAGMARARLAGVALNDIGPELAPAGLARIKEDVARAIAWGRAIDLAEAADRARSINQSAFPNADLAFWVDFARRTFRQRDDGRWELDFDPAILQPILAADAAIPTPNLWGLFDAFAGLPLAAIRGSLSNLLTAQTLSAMRARRPDLIFAEVAEIGHAPLLTEPAAWVAIEQWLGRLVA